MTGSLTDPLILEAGVPSYQTHADRDCLRSAEKAIRMPTDHPLHSVYHDGIPAKNNRQSWKTKADRFLARMPKEARLREPILFFGRAPWEEPSFMIVYLEVLGVSGRNDDPELK